MVVGQAERTLPELSDTQSGRLEGQQPIEKNGLILRPVIELPLQDPRYQLSVGLVRLNQDFRRVPLSWTAYEDREGVLSKPQSRETLSFAAAKLYRAPFPGATDNLAALNDEGRHPLTTLLPWNKFIHVEAAELMCKERAPVFWLPARRECR